MTKSRRDKLYIDDVGWGPEAGSIEYGYRVPFGEIHVFIGKIGEPSPEPNICTDIIEMAQRESSSGETTSLYQLQDGRLGGCSYGDTIPDPYEPPNRVASFMAGTQPVQNSSTAAALISGSAAATTAGAGGPERGSSLVRLTRRFGNTVDGGG